MDQYLSQRDFTNQIAGGHLGINLPDNTSPTGFRTFKIRSTDLLGGSGIVPIKMLNVGNNQSWVAPADSWVNKFSFKTISGSPTIKVGSAPNGNDILDVTNIGILLPFEMNEYCENQTTFYFTISGGTINIRIDFQVNYSQ